MTPRQAIEKHLPAIKQMAAQIVSPKDNTFSRMVTDFESALAAEKPAEPDPELVRAMNPRAGDVVTEGNHRLVVTSVADGYVWFNYIDPFGNELRLSISLDDWAHRIQQGLAKHEFIFKPA